MATLLNTNIRGEQIDNATISGVHIVNASITPVKTDVYNSPTDGDVLTYKSDTSQFEWNSIGTMTVNDSPTGSVNGANTTFVLSDTPVGNTLEVNLNGILQQPGVGNDYTISGDTITFVAAPETGDIILCSYLVSAGLGGGVYTDHGNLDGLGDDDHQQYILVDGSRAFTGVVAGITPTIAAHLSTKGYVDDELAAQTHAASDITTGTFADARIAQSNVTQHEGSINHNALLNTHNLTSDINHNTLLNTHNLTTDIDHNQLTNYAIAQHRTINDSATGSTDLWSAEKIGNEITTATGSLTVNHSELNQLDYASAGHTGFASSAQLTTTSGDIVDQIPSDFYSQSEVDTISGSLNTKLDTHKTSDDHDDRYYTETEIDNFDFLLTTEMTTISGDLQTEIDGKSDTSHKHDKITEGNTYVEVVDTGTGYVTVEVDAAETVRFNPSNVTVAADILPEMTGASGTVSTRNIGSSSAKFNDIYCHDLLADAGSIYVNDKKVIEDVSDVITISTDNNQRLKLQTTGDAGDTYIEGEGGIQFHIPNTYSNKDITFSNESTSGQINIGGSGQTVKLTGDVDITAGTVDHGDLTGLGDDDHTQYILVTGSRAFSGAVGGVSPTTSAHLATKGYVDGLIQGLDWQDSVKDRDLTAPPGSPSTGDRYIIANSATGAWAGHDGDVAEYNGSGWDFTTKAEGLAAWVEDEDVLYTYNGSAWVKFGATVTHNNLSGLQGGTSAEYYHLTSAQHTDLTDGGDSSSHKHDDRYYTETEIGTWRNSTTQTEMGYVHGVTSDIQTQLNGKLSTTGKAADSDKLDNHDSTYFLNTSTALAGDVSGTYGATVVANDSHTHDTRYYTETEITTWRNGTTQTEMGYVHGVTSDIQTQLNGKLSTTGKAADSDKLDNHDSTYFLNTSTALAGDVSGTYGAIVVADDSHNHIISNVDGLQTALNGKLSTTGKAADSDKLDSLDSSQFVRADASSVITGAAGQYTKWSDGLEVRLGTGNDVRMKHDSVNSYIDNYTGDLFIRAGATPSMAITALNAGGVNLYYGGAGRLYTNSVGVEATNLEITGTTKTAGYFYAGATDPTNTNRLNYDGYLYATKIYNAVYNDIADFQKVIDVIEYGKCYYDTPEGAKICNERCQMAVIGIASDTYGFGIGKVEDEGYAPFAIGGWVLAHVDKEYPVGMPLTNDENGNLTEITLDEKRNYPERIVATYKKVELNEFWGPANEVKVNGRAWVKVK